MNLQTTEKRVAVLENEQAVEFHFSHPTSVEINGNIYMGRVTKVLPGLQAAFIDIGLEKNGFLHRDQLSSFQNSKIPIEDKKKKNINEFVREGEYIPVQVEKNSLGTKGPKLTNIIEFPGQFLVYLPKGNYIAVSKKMDSEASRVRWKLELQKLLTEHEGVIVRTAAEKQSELVIAEELERLRSESIKLEELYSKTKRPALLKSFDNLTDRLIQEIGSSEIDEIIVDEIQAFKRMSALYPNIKFTYHLKKVNIFSHYSVEQDIEKLSKKMVWLQNGSYLLFEHTEAMTIIDVNTGKFTGKTNLLDTVWKTNSQAAFEIGRQIRLRDIGGMILVDFIDMKSEEERNRIIHIMKQQASLDRTRTIVYGFTKLGILEMTRKRVRENTYQQQVEMCLTCGNGYVHSKESLTYKLERELYEFKGQDAEGIWIEVTKDILGMLTDNSNMLQHSIENALHMKLFLTEQVNSKPNYVIRHIGTIQEIEQRINSG